MGYFVAYRHTGADPERLNVLLPAVCESLKELGQAVYCTYFDDAEFKAKGSKPRQIMEHAFSKIEEMDGLFVVLDGEEKSEGMLMEVGYCVARGLNIVVAKRSGVDNTYVPNMADYSFEYDNVDDLKQKILTLETSRGTEHHRS